MAALILHFDPSCGEAHAEIGLGSIFGSIAEHRPRLTPPCSNFAQFTEEIRSLHSELDRIENEAKEKFASAARINQNYQRSIL